MDSNITFNNNQAELKVNPKMYPLETIYSAAYVFLDNAYIILDGNLETQVLVKIEAKEGKDIKIIAKEFYNELLNYADYSKRAEATKKIREMILQRAIISNDPNVLDDQEFESLLKDLETDDDNETVMPWE